MTMGLVLSFVSFVSIGLSGFSLGVAICNLFWLNGMSRDD